MVNDEISQTLVLGDKVIHEDSPPFIIAEMSGNHNQSLERALSIVDAAAQSGAHALKIQTYTADTMTINCEHQEFTVDDTAGLWKGKNLYQLYQQAYTPWEWHEALFERCQQHGMIGFSTPFDASAVDFLESLNVPFYKIASFENTDIPLIKKVAQTGKPVIISTGMASISELDEAVVALKRYGCGNFALLKCTSTYPASPEASNIMTIPHMAKLFNCPVGLSDHTHGVGVAVASVALGARIIEKHFTLNRAEGGVDAAFSLEPHELASLVIETKRAWQGLGRIAYGTHKNEDKMKVYRRSIYAVKNIKAGEALSEDNVKVIRPGLGLAPKYFDTILGEVCSQDIGRGTPITWKNIR